VNWTLIAKMGCLKLIQTLLERACFDQLGFRNLKSFEFGQQDYFLGLQGASNCVERCRLVFEHRSDSVVASGVLQTQILGAP
jgi:hypothetical protein